MTGSFCLTLYGSARCRRLARQGSNSQAVGSACEALGHSVAARVAARPCLGAQRRVGEFVPELQFRYDGCTTIGIGLEHGRETTPQAHMLGLAGSSGDPYVCVWL